MQREDPFNSATVERMLKVPGLKWHTNPPDVIPMWIAAPDFPIHPEIKRALREAVDSEDLYYNTDTAAREAMAEKIRRVNKIRATPSDVMVLQGVDPSIPLAVRSSCSAGNEVIITDPMYTPFRRAIETAEAKPILWKLDEEEGYRFEDEALKKLITPNTRLICVCNPHNPTSRVMTKEELRAVADIAVDNKIKVMSDELWEDIVFDERRHISIASLNPEIEKLTITSWGFSKTFGIAGLQLGYLCTTNNETMAEIHKQATGIQRGSSTPAKAAAQVMLDKTLDSYRRGMMTHLHKIRGLCAKRLNAMPGVTFTEPQGTYVPFPRFDVRLKARELTDYLLKEGKVGLSAGTGFGALGEGHQRMCIATSEIIMNEALDRIERALAKLG